MNVWNVPTNYFLGFVRAPCQPCSNTVMDYIYVSKYSYTKSSLHFFVLGRQLWTLGTYWTSKIGRTLPLGPSAAILCSWLTLIMCSWGNSNISNNFRARLTSWRTFWFICVQWAGCMYQNNKTNALYISDSFNILPLQHDWATPWALALDSCHLSNTTLEIMLLFREENYYYYSYNEDVRNLPHNIATYR